MECRRRLQIEGEKIARPWTQLTRGFGRLPGQLPRALHSGLSNEYDARARRRAGRALRLREPPGCRPRQHRLGLPRRPPVRVRRQVLLLLQADARRGRRGTSATHSRPSVLLGVPTHECGAAASTPQHISGKIEANVDDLQVAIYDDEALFWNYIMTDPSCDCRCKLSPRHAKRVLNVTASTDDLDIPFEFDFDVHEHIRPRFWYVALARCVPGGDQYRPSFTQITQQEFDKYYFSAWFELHFTQADGSELPVQQRGLPLTYSIMAVLSAGVAVAQTISARAMRQSESFHSIVKLLTMVVGFFFAANALLGLHYVALAANGVGVVFFYYAAKIVQVFVRVGTILLAMLVAKGWTITSVTLHGQETLSCVMVTFLGLYLSMAMWYLVWLDPASTLYIYESWPGVGICSIQLAVLGWFAVTLFETRELEESTSKRRFFLQVKAITSYSSPLILSSHG